jgi:hypothetical protein
MRNSGIDGTFRDIPVENPSRTGISVEKHNG